VLAPPLPELLEPPEPAAVPPVPVVPPEAPTEPPLPVPLEPPDDVDVPPLPVALEPPDEVVLPPEPGGPSVPDAPHPPTPMLANPRTTANAARLLCRRYLIGSPPGRCWTGGRQGSRDVPTRTVQKVFRRLSDGKSR